MRVPFSRKLSLLLLLLLLLLLVCTTGHAGTRPPPELTIAFIGDQGLGLAPEAVLQLIEDEGADAVVHAGDFDYGDDPEAWDAQIDAVLGSDFPYFAVIGNHDDDVWSGAGGYQERIEARMVRLGIPWEGDIGVKAAIHWQGLHLVMTAPGIFELGDPDGEYEDYIRDQFSESDSVWRISTWHKLMNAMQVGAKLDESGWGVYEASREAGAIVATAHEHSYSRTHLMSGYEEPAIVSTTGPLELAADDPTTADDEGSSFAFVSGLAGRSIRNQVRDADWWASVYTGSQGATYGALFGVFHVNGDPRLAHFYFKDVDGNVIDDFSVVSTTGDDDPPTPVCGDGMLGAGEQCDDGNTLAGDGCSEQCQDEADGLGCAPAPIAGCLSATKSRLSISERKAGKEKWKAKLERFDNATEQSDFGNPLTGSTRYDLCLYDGNGQLAAELTVDRAGRSCGPQQKPCFKDRAGEGWRYKDPVGDASGTRKLELRSGPTGKGKTIWQAGNHERKGQRSLPTGIAAALSGTTSATLQLKVSDSLCLESALETVKKADGSIFKARSR